MRIFRTRKPAEIGVVHIASDTATHAECGRPLVAGPVPPDAPVCRRCVAIHMDQMEELGAAYESLAIAVNQFGHCVVAHQNRFAAKVVD